MAYFFVDLLPRAVRDRHKREEIDVDLTVTSRPSSYSSPVAADLRAEEIVPS